MKFALLLLLLTCTGCTSNFTGTWSNGEEVEFLTFENGFAPNVTLVKGELDGTQEGLEILVYQGAASMNQAWTMGAGTAAAGAFIGYGIKNADADQTNVNQQGGGARAKASASAAAVSTSKAWQSQRN